MTADDRTSAAGDTAPPATSDDTDPTPNVDVLTALRSAATYDEFLSNGGNGSDIPRNVGESLFLIFKSFDGPSARSMRRYRRPSNVREFAAQANSVATDILNGDIDLDTARAYSSVARTVAQSISAQTARSRFLKTAPDLDFPALDDE